MTFPLPNPLTSLPPPSPPPLLSINFVPHKDIDEDDDGDQTENSGDNSPKLSFEMRKTRSGGSTQKKKKEKVHWRKLATKVSLEKEDDDDDDDRHVLVGKESSSSQKKKRRCCRNRGPSLVWAMTKTFWKTLLISAFFKLLQDLLTFASPQLLK